MATEDELATADVVGTQLIRLVKFMERAHAHHQAQYPDAVERPTYLLLVHLVKDGPQRASALAEAVRSDPSTVSRQIAHLARLGFVERTADPDDGRATLIAASAEGVRVFEENRRTRNEAIAGLLGAWPAGDRERLADLLTRLIVDVETAWTTPNGPLVAAPARA